MRINILCLIFLPGLIHSQNIILVNGHAHNDYCHKTPLAEALYYGFNSVETDIWLRNDSLFIAHDSAEIIPNRLLENLYLEPLKNIAENNRGWIQQEHLPFVLLIDIKSDSIQTYLQLHKILANYNQLVTTYTSDGQIHQRAIEVVISGNRPIQFMKNQELRYATMDGRLSDVDGSLPFSLVWLISEDARKCFEWRGTGDIPQADLDFLQRTVNKVHTKGRKIRFWATIDEPGEARSRQWNVLLDYKVDIINTDDLRGLWLYMLEKQKRGDLQ